MQVHIEPVDFANEILNNDVCNDTTKVNLGLDHNLPIDVKQVGNALIMKAIANANHNPFFHTP